MSFGYLLGRADAANGVPFPEPPVNEQVISVIEQCRDGEYDSKYAADLVFGLIYKWLDKVFENESYDLHDVLDEGARYVLAEAFQPLVKPGVISSPLPEKEES